MRTSHPLNQPWMYLANLLSLAGRTLRCARRPRLTIAAVRGSTRSHVDVSCVLSDACKPPAGELRGQHRVSRIRCCDGVAGRRQRSCRARERVANLARRSNAQHGVASRDGDTQSARRRHGIPIAVAIREHVEQQRCVSHVARKRSERCESVPVLGISTGQGHATRCRFDADDATAGGGDANRSTAIRTHGKGGHAGGHRNRRASARAAGGAVQVPRVAGRRERLGLGERPDRELGHDRPAHDNRAGLAQPPHDNRVLRGRRLGRGTGAVGRGFTGDLDVVFDGNRDAGQRQALEVGPVAQAFCLVTGRTFEDRDEGMQARLQRVDTPQARLEKLDGVEGPGAYEPRHLGSGQSCEAVVVAVTDLGRGRRGAVGCHARTVRAAEASVHRQFCRFFRGPTDREDRSPLRTPQRPLASRFRPSRTRAPDACAPSTPRCAALCRPRPSTCRGR